jgi:hypothetical protein
MICVSFISANRGLHSVSEDIGMLQFMNCALSEAQKEVCIYHWNAKERKIFDEKRRERISTPLLTAYGLIKKY